MYDINKIESKISVIERLAMDGKELPKGYTQPEQLLFLSLRVLHWEYRHREITLEQARKEKERLAREYIQAARFQVIYQQAVEIRNHMGQYSEFPAAANSVAASRTTRDIRSLADDIFDFTARAFQIPPVLLFGDVAGTQDAMTRWLTTCIDPLCDQLQEEINRKRYGKEAYLRGDYLQIDTSTIIHFDMFQNAGNVEKLIGSGAFSINDVLAAAGQPRIREPWADAHWLTLNISPIDQAARTVESSTRGGASSG